MTGPRGSLPPALATGKPTPFFPATSHFNLRTADIGLLIRDPAVKSIAATAVVYFKRAKSFPTFLYGPERAVTRQTSMNTCVIIKSFQEQEDSGRVDLKTVCVLKSR